MIQSIKDAEYYNELDASHGCIIKIKRVSDDGVWVVTDKNKEFLIPHHTKGEPILSKPRLVSNLAKPLYNSV